MKMLARLSCLVAFGSLTIADAMSAPAAPVMPPAPVVPAARDVLRATLDNGLRVIIVRNTLAPVVATSVNYLVGSDEAPEGFPGTAHAQEHMMFRGSPGLSADQLASIGAIMGGNFNANTRESLTQYLYTIPAEDVDVALHIESTRMRGVVDGQDDWDHERGAIEQEVATDLSSPAYKLYERLRQIMFDGTPYAHDALGTRPSFERTRASDLKAFYDQWYAPNNAVLIIVGDVELEPTMKKVRDLFGDIHSKTLPARPTWPLRPVKAQHFQVDTDRPEGMQMIAMRTPGLDSPDFPAFEVLADVLSSHRFALYGLVADGKALDAEFSLDPMQRAGLAYSTVSFAAGTDPKRLENEVRTILKDVATRGVPAELVDAAKQQERSEAEFQKNSIAGAASIWSEAVALYGLESPEDDLQRIEKVSLADVNRVAREYLKLDTAVSAVMIPHGSGRPVPASGGFGGPENIALGEAKPVALPDWAQVASQRLQVPELTTLPIVTRLPNGLTLIVQPERISDTVSIYGHIRTRPEVQAPPDKQGVAQLLDALLPFGTQQLDRVAFEEALDEIGAREETGPDFSIETLNSHFDRAVELLAANELHPALPDTAFNALRPQFSQLVAARNRSPGHLVQQGLKHLLFPKTDPTLVEATPQSVGSLTLQDLQTYHHDTFRPDLTSIVIIGKVTPDQALSAVTKYFGDWRAEGPTPSVDLPSAPPNAAAQLAVPDDSRVQDDVTLAQTAALTRSDADFYALELGSAVLGGGFYSTRLSVDLRKNAGLVYSVDSELQSGRSRTIYMVRYACDPQNVGKAQDLVIRDIRSMQDTPVDQEELDRVKALLLRQIPLNESSVEDIAHGFLHRQDMNLPLDEPLLAAHRYIELTPTDVQSTFRKWIRPDALVRVTQGPPPQ
ncbi:MAG TPA: pitrilysin family protein [Steroidobacteraceae bacterium]|jgi:zinc protease|nr:pitrilysin family protein [Steroidobacteraceae bacterium]